MHSFRTRGSKLNDMQLGRIRWHAGDVDGPITCLSVFPAVVVRGSWHYLCPDGRAARVAQGSGMWFSVARNATDVHYCPAIHTAVGLCGVSACRTTLRYGLVSFRGLLSEAVKTSLIIECRSFRPGGACPGCVYSRYHARGKWLASTLDWKWQVNFGADVDVPQAQVNDGTVLDMLYYEYRKGAEKSQLDSRAYFELHD
ncbi:hypothetical protein BDZ85DRAFT_250061 [Elsinoe ampelina]|uniref:Uncharacterized protein n=1 Tax=Elsinoe ampelina TaxID=302913 RepID=A0A6A6GBS6_9PEZI|nr:hypothetical protein BDZ85DRAFT_250061 [Elsinoe ampelina]